MVVAFTYDKKPVTAGQLGCVGAMALLLKDAIKPNLVQTLEGQPFFIHGFPFANIAHGNNSIIATSHALKMADYVVTEAGFATDLGTEKCFDIVCRSSGLRPDCVVLVASIRALKMHGGCPHEKCEIKNLEALHAGFANLDKHIDNVRKFGVPPGRRDEPLPHRHDGGGGRGNGALQGARRQVSRLLVFDKGGEGGVALAKQVIEAIEKDKN